MVKNNKTCIVCGEKYTFCTRCEEYDNEPRWRAIYHDANCMEIFNIAANYLAGKTTKEETRKKFDSCDLTNKEHFHHKIIEVIDEVYAEKAASINKGNKRKTAKSVEGQNKAD